MRIVRIAVVLVVASGAALVGCGDTYDAGYLEDIGSSLDAGFPDGTDGDPSPHRPSPLDVADAETTEGVVGGDSAGDAPPTCVPSAELCNGADDDCDGAVDEDFSDLGSACDGDDPGDCAGGVWQCDASGTGQTCVEPPWPDCVASSPCVQSAPVEDPDTCQVTCGETPLEPCCGNGVVEAGESCDGDCPSGCDDGVACTTDTLTGSAEECDAVCAHVVGQDPGTDTDGDALTDCVEATDGLAWTDPTAFNGMLATIGEAPSGFFTSAQCDLFFGDTFGEMWALFDDSTQAHDIWQGWEYQAGTTNDYSSAADYDFEPNWTHSDSTGVHNSFQVLYRAKLLLDGDGTHCFSVDTGAGGIGPGDIAGRRNSCGRVYLDFSDSSVPMAETGYGSNESPIVGCVQAAAGVHDLALAARHYEAHFYAPLFRVRYCYGGASECVPDQSLTRQMMRSWGASVCVPACGAATCGDDGCGGSCGSCVGGATCDAGTCVGGSCTADCSGKDCGDDGCGGSCGACPPGETCAGGGQCAPGAPVCGDGAVAPSEACDDGNTETETPPDASSLPTDACISDCSINMHKCGDGTLDSGLGEACDDGDTDDEDECTSSCTVGDSAIGAACHADGVGADELDYTAGTIVGCDNVPATFGGCVRACLRSIDPGFSQPLVYNPGGYCTLLAIKCEGGIACGFAPQPGDFDTCNSCPSGYHLEETVTEAAGSVITSRSCLATCSSQADCRWRQWDDRFGEWGQYQCLPSTSDPGVGVCQDVRQHGP